MRSNPKLTMIVILFNPIFFIVNCTWATWGSWGACSTTCGEGTQQRMRSFDQPAQNGGVACTGASVDGRRCNSQDCPAAGNQMCSNLTWIWTKNHFYNCCIYLQISMEYNNTFCGDRKSEDIFCNL